MSLQIILGNAGAGKSTCLYEEMIRQSIEYPDRNYFVIVPEQFTMQTLSLIHILSQRNL